MTKTTSGMEFKKWFTALLAAVCVLPAQALEVTVKGSDLSIRSAHPRLLADEAAFKQHRKAVLACRSKALVRMHETYMAMADACVAEDAPVEYAPDAAGKMLHVSREVLRQMGCCAYAWRFTKDPKYLRRAESVLNQVCSFPDWHPVHYLDAAEMTAAVALGYDWLYARLKPETRERCEQAVTAFAFDTAEDNRWRHLFRKDNNWHQVLNASLAVAAIALYDTDPERCRALVERAVLDNALHIERGYAPDGIYPEGHTYWGYGTGFQELLDLSLEGVYGTDFGLSQCPGFMASATFERAARGNIGLAFNYSDSGIRAESRPQLWYFAWKSGEPGLAYWEVKDIEENPKYALKDRLGFLYLLCASRCAVRSVPAPGALTFSGQGSNPLVMTRSGWDRKDPYLGVKGGGAQNSHAHLDAGSFVFDAGGFRWLCEPPAPGYSKSEAALRTINSTPWNRKQDSHRWKVFGYNNRQHNTLTINGKDHDVRGCATLEEVFDTPERRGGRFDLSSIFPDDAARVERTICIEADGSLRITDCVAAKDSLDARVSWNYTTHATVSLSDGGILLQQKGRTMRICVKGASVDFRTGLDMPEDVPDCLLPFYEAPVQFAGYTLTVPAGTEATITTTCRLL